MEPDLDIPEITAQEKRIAPSPKITWGFILGFWTLIGFLYASQSVLLFYFTGETIDWGRLISWSFTGWWLWAALTPVVFRLAETFPIQRTRLRRGLWLHLGLGVGLGVLHAVLESSTNVLVWTLVGQPIPPLQRLIQVLAYNLHVNLLVYGALVGAWHARNYYVKYRERELEASRLALITSQLEAQLSKAQLQALKMQLHPHFLFNTHHAILALMLKNENEAAIQMLTRFSDLLRLTLENTGTQTVSLKQELEFLDSYLEIQKMRFQDRLRVTMDIDPHALRAQVPNLITQPLVENAIQHAIAPHSSAGLIEVTAFRENGQLSLKIIDDGPGLQENQATLQEGIGISNTRARLSQLYGDTYSFDLSNRANKGLQVTIKIPFNIDGETT